MEKTTKEGQTLNQTNKQMTTQLIDWQSRKETSKSTKFGDLIPISFLSLLFSINQSINQSNL